MAEPFFIQPRTALFLFASALVVSAASFASGCGGSDGCDDTLDCSAATEPTGNPQTGSTSSGMSGSSGTAGGGGNGAGGGGEGGGVPNCDPISGTVSTTCGIFVSTSKGSDGAAGSKSAPVATLAKALELADSNGKRVYACNESFSEALVVPAGLTLYGALDCASDWSYTPAKQTKLTADPDQVPMTLAKTGDAQPTRINDFAITSQDATVDGGSSIAVLAVNVTAEFTSCEIVSGKGASGSAGDALQDQDAAASGSVGNAGCAATQNVGGDAGPSHCPGDANNSGGVGGPGRTDLSAPGAGAPGTPQPRGATPQDGLGGEGVTTSQVCKKGHDGDDGMNGTAAEAVHDIGYLDVTGYVAPATVDGLTVGTNGQGGGGGGGGNICGANAGASGGGGGGGGCGGAVGKGGQSGGSSIGLLTFGSQIGIHGGSIRAAPGGDGGKGGLGQVGGTGGTRGNGVPAGGSCAGGDGGRGGNGGAAAGGIGGHSIAIAVVGASPTLSNNPAITTSAKGAGAQGGDASVGKSDDGKACQVLDFNDPSGSCP